MRRRKGNNKLLMRIIMISVLVHVLALPILAHYGAFKKIQERYMETRLVQLPPPERERARPEERKVEHPHQTAHAGRRTASAGARQHTFHSNNLSQPKVVAAAGTGDGNGEGDVDQGSGKAGQLPTAPAPAKAPEKEASAPPPPATPTEQKPPSEPVKVAENPKPAAPVAPEPAAPKPAHVPVFTDVQPVDSPQPTIPDDLRADALDKTYIAEFDVSPDGTPANVKMAQSTGNDELDQLAMDAARKWR